MGNRYEQEEYINTISEPAKAEMVRRQFVFANMALIRAQNMAGPGAESPVIWIDVDPTPQAQQMWNRIYLFEGLIDHCLTPPLATLAECFGDTHLARKGEPPCAEASLAWITVHEYMHHGRRHDDLEGIEGSDMMTRRAIEFDADLTAIACVFRVLQAALGQMMSDDELRLFTLYCVFWSLRTLPELEEQTDHESMAMRIFRLVQKLAMMSATPDEVPDARCERPKTHERLELLLMLAMKMDAYAVHRSQRRLTPLITELASHTVSGVKSATTRWDELRGTAANLTKSKDWVAEDAVARAARGELATPASEVSEELKESFQEILQTPEIEVRNILGSLIGVQEFQVREYDPDADDASTNAGETD